MIGEHGAPRGEPVVQVPVVGHDDVPEGVTSDDRVLPDLAHTWADAHGLQPHAAEECKGAHAQEIAREPYVRQRAAAGERETLNISEGVRASAR